MSWSGHTKGTFNPFESVSPRGSNVTACTRIASIAHHTACSCSAILLEDGSVAMCMTDASESYGLAAFEIGEWLLEPSARATHAALSAQAQMLAVGCHDGVTRLWDCAGSWQDGPLRELSLGDWGYDIEHTGAVASIDWTPDGLVCSARFLHVRLNNRLPLLAHTTPTIVRRKAFCRRAGGRCGLREAGLRGVDSVWLPNHVVASPRPPHHG
jgi:WD40 repeat protein